MTSASSASTHHRQPHVQACRARSDHPGCGASPAAGVAVHPDDRPGSRGTVGRHSKAAGAANHLKQAVARQQSPPLVPHKGLAADELPAVAEGAERPPRRPRYRRPGGQRPGGVLLVIPAAQRCSGAYVPAAGPAPRPRHQCSRCRQPGRGRRAVSASPAGRAHPHLVTEHVSRRYALHDLLRAYAADQARSTDSEPERGSRNITPAWPGCTRSSATTAVKPSA